MKTARLFTLIAALLAFPLAAQAPGGFQQRLLDAHNQERARIGVKPLEWSPVLAAQARVWADDLARRGVFEHARERFGAGENLWMGTSGYYAPEAMIGSFIREKQYFRPGTFPEVSTTGKWQDVGHYTQLIWAGTSQLGCATATGNGRDILVCRYYPAGNVRGQQVP